MEVYASGNWHVKEGQESEFVRKWEDWLEWARDSVPGYRWAKLMRSEDDPRRFVSLSLWEDDKARTDWKGRAGFRDGLTALRGMCEEFVGGDYKIEVTVGSEVAAAGIR